MYKNQYNRKKKSAISGSKILAGIAGIAVLFIGGRFLSTLGAKKTATTETPANSTMSGTNSATADWYVGKKVSLEGTITPSADTLDYTHTITLSGSNEPIQAMSSTLDLSPYKGHMFIRAAVSKFDGKKFLLDIESISHSAESLGSIDLPTSTSARLFPSLGVKLAITPSSNMQYTTSGKNITITQMNTSGSMTIEGFRCEVGLIDRDCDALTTSHNGGSFVSAGGMTYYKGDTNTRFARHAGGRGYRVQADSESTLYTISSIIIPLNDTYVLSLLPQVKQLCGNPTSASKPVITKEALTTWNIAYGSCRVRLLIDETGEKLSLISGASTPATTGTSTTTPAGTHNSIPTNSLVPNTTTQAPIITKSGYTYTNTNGGYAIQFPSAKIAYNGSMIQETLGVKDLLCYMRLDIKDYADKDKDDVGPALSIYECISKLSSYTLMKALPSYGFQTNAAGTKLFFTKVHNSVWADFARKIKVN